MRKAREKAAACNHGVWSIQLKGRGGVVCGFGVLLVVGRADSANPSIPANDEPDPEPYVEYHTSKRRMERISKGLSGLGSVV